MYLPELHPIHKKMRQILMDYVDEISFDRISIRFEIEGEDAMIVKPSKKKLIPARCGIDFIYEFQEEKKIVKTESYVDGILFSKITTPTVVKPGYEFRLAIYYK